MKGADAQRDTVAERWAREWLFSFSALVKGFVGDCLGLGSRKLLRLV